MRRMVSKPIIQNGHCASKEDAMYAIDVYSAERKQHYTDHPEAAGEKTWGLERPSSQFAPEGHCKDLTYR